MSNQTLTAGVARIDITPPVGFRMQGVMRRTQGAVGVESALLATALVLDDENTSFVIIDCDLIGLDLPLATEIREAVGQRLGTSTGCVALGCTHTHNGPSTSRGNLGGVHDVGGDPAERRRYLDELATTRRPTIAGVRADYDKVVRQRTALLKTAAGARFRGDDSALQTLDVWDGHLAAHGAQLIAARIDLVNELAPEVANKNI